MRWLLIALLLLSSAFAASALNESNFGVEPKVNPIVFQSDGLNRDVTFLVSLVKVDFRAFNVSVRAVNPPEGVQLASADAIVIEDIVKGDSDTPVTLSFTADTQGSYDFSGSLDVVSWDDSVSLSVDPMGEDVSARKLAVSGTTDAAALCASHKFKGIWAEQENCNVRITINNEEPFYADEEGHFSREIELKEGVNDIRVLAMDPGGNTEETTFSVTFTPSATTLAEENIVLVVSGVLALVVIIGGLLWLRSRSTQKQAEIAEFQANQAQLSAQAAKDTAITKAQEAVTEADTRRVASEIFSLQRDQWVLVEKLRFEMASNNAATANAVTEKLKENARKHFEHEPFFSRLVDCDSAALKASNLEAGQLVPLLKTRDYKSVIKDIVPFVGYNEKFGWEVASRVSEIYNGLIRNAVLERLRG